MQLIADSTTDAELIEAARYFAKVRARRASRVVESDSVPRSSAQRPLDRSPREGVSRVGDRLVEVAVDLRRHELHDRWPSTWRTCRAAASRVDARWRSAIAPA
jgi:hypothetical protein